MRWQKRDAATTIKDVILRNTGLSESEFLHPNKNPKVANLEQAIIMIKDAVAHNRPIFIMGDYDCDGVTATAILYRMFLHGFHYRNVTVRFPKRFSEGYGLSTEVIDEVNDGLLLTVDNGITAVEAIQKAKDKGLDVVVIDHHMSDPKKGLPAADAIVNPNALPNSEFNGYCGAGLAYKVAEQTGVCSEDLLAMLLSLAAIGTVADVMKLTGDNRNLVIGGLNAINNGKGPKGLNVLMQTLGIDFVTEEDIGFKFGPIVNAAGRLYDDGAKVPFVLLAMENFPDNLPSRLIEVNEKRKILVKQGTEESERIIAETNLYGKCPLLVYAKNVFHEGVVGIIAGQLAETFHVPTIVLGDADSPGLVKGSARSYGDFNLKLLLDKVSDLLVSYGGHPGAAGLTLRADDLDTLYLALQEKAQSMWVAEDSDLLYYDLEIDTADIPVCLNEIQKYAPYGEGNPKVVFKIKDYRLTPRNGNFFQTLGNDGKVLKLFGATNSAIGFGLAQKYEDIGQPSALDLYGHLGINRFNHKEEIQIEMLDFEKAKDSSKSSLANLLSQRMQMFK